MSSGVSVFAIILLFCACIPAQNQPEQAKTSERKGFDCPEDAGRIDVLNQMARILNDSVPEYRNFSIEREEFRVFRGNPSGFVIWDLLNPENQQSSSKCVELIDGHVYHVVPFYYVISFSHIVFVEKGKLKSFRSVNCAGRGDSVEDAVNYALKEFADNPKKDDIIARIRDYRKYGRYWKFHEDDAIRCKQPVPLTPSPAASLTCDKIPEQEHGTEFLLRRRE